MHNNDEEWFVRMRVITMIALPCLPFVYVALSTQTSQIYHVA